MADMESRAAPQIRARSGSRAGALAVDSRLWLGVIALLGLTVRLHGLGAQSLWADEIAAVEIARQPLRVLWSDWMVRETNPPLYYAFLHLWMLAFGPGVAAVRSLSALAGAAAIPLIYALGRQIASPRVGLIAAILTALWPHQIYYSQEARGYIFGVLGALIAVIGLVAIAEQARAPEERRSGLQTVWPWAAYLFGTTLALYVHTTHVLLPALANLYFAWFWLVQSPRRFKPLLTWTLVNAAVVALWAWWGWITWRQLHLPHSNVAWIARPSLSQGLSMVLTVDGPAGVTLAKSTLRTAMLGVGALFAAAAIFGAARLKLRHAVLLAVFGLGAPALLFLISQTVAIMLPRTMLWAQFAVILGLASALAAIRLPAARAATVLIAAALLMLGGRLYDPKEPWAALTADLAQKAGPGEVVLVSSVSDGVYLQHECETIACPFHVIDLATPGDMQNRWAEPLYKGNAIQPAALAARLAGGQRFWTVSRWEDDPRGAVRALSSRPLRMLSTPLPTFMNATEWSAR